MSDKVPQTEKNTGMTLDEAIEVINKELDGVFINYPDKLRKAHEMSIEAFKQIKREREKHVGFWADRLPGETEK